MPEPITCERCGSKNESTVHLAKHLRNTHGLLLREGLIEAKATRERQVAAQPSYEALLTENERLRAMLGELLATIDYTRDNIRPHRKIHDFLWGRGEHGVICRSRAVLRGQK